MRQPDFDALVLATIARLGEPYGVPLRKAVEEAAGRSVSIGALYAALERLETAGQVVSREGEGTAERGWRPRRYWRVAAERKAETR